MKSPFILRIASIVNGGVKNVSLGDLRHGCRGVENAIAANRCRGVKNASLGGVPPTVLPDEKFGTDMARPARLRFAIKHLPICALPLLCFLLAAPALRAEEAPRKITLTDGVRLILKPETTTDSVAITLFVQIPPDASADEDAAGEIVSRAFLYGNENSSFESIAETVGAVGGGLETFRTADYVAVRIVTGAGRIPEAAHLLAQALKNANFTRDALTRACHDAAESQAPRPDQPFAGELETLRAAFRPFPFPNDYALRRVTPEAARAYFHERYTPLRTVISLVGNFVPKQATSVFDDNFFDFQRVAQRPIISKDRPASADLPAAPIRAALPAPLAMALVAVAPPAVGSPDYPAFLTLHALLGSGHASRLFRNIRDRQGFGYEVNAAYRPTQPEIWTAYLQWDAGRKDLTAESALKLLNAEISGVISNPPTDAEMTRARALAAANLVLHAERARDESFVLGWQESQGVGYNYSEVLSRRIAAVTREDILRVARTLFQRRAALVALPPDAAQPVSASRR